MDHNLCLNFENNINNLHKQQQHQLQNELLIKDISNNLLINNNINNINNNYDYDKYNYNYHQQYEFNCNSIENSKTKKSLTKNLFKQQLYNQQQQQQQQPIKFNNIVFEKDNHQKISSISSSSYLPSSLPTSSILICSSVKKRFPASTTLENNNLPMSSLSSSSSSSSSLLSSPLSKISSSSSSTTESVVTSKSSSITTKLLLSLNLINSDNINNNNTIDNNNITDDTTKTDCNSGDDNNIKTTTKTNNIIISKKNNSIKLLISEYFRLISCSWPNDVNIINNNRRQKRRKRGRLRNYYCYIIELNILIISLILKYIINIMKNLYRLMKNLIISKIFTTKLIWIFGIYIAIQILPINIVNAYNSNEINFDEDDNENDSLLYSTENSNIGSTETYDSDNKTILPAKTPLFPKDLFTKTQLENGAVAFHILGVIYMFVALAIVCDEFFVPALDVIIEKLGITDDVAGATFMAAGGSAPELFTSVIGVFVSFDDVGIGTIVGSAVFNILFVIGMCALFSKTILSLTWWPLFRDCTFYSISLLTLIYFFRDNLIYWWEALVLFFIYVGYVGFMKWNQQVERCVKKIIYKNKGNAANSSETSMATQPGGSVTSRAASETRSGPPGSSSGATGNSSGGSTHTGAKFRHGLLQLMIHTIDPLHDGKVDEKATQLHAIASLKVLLDATKPQRGAATTSAANHVKINLKETTLANDRPNGNIDTTIDSGNDPDEPPEALDMAWPSEGRKRITYVLVAPLLFPLWLTLPDTKTPKGKRYYPVTFIGSIVWIAAYSYLMVWWANVAGDTARIPPEVMGLTFLAAGTSIPDLITSVIVARKGFGDMAVSSSVGSNIFDVTVGLPIPWLLYGIIYQQPVEVNSHGMICSITILFMMLLFVVISIACFHWKMNKGLGLTMFFLYFVFVAVSLMFEYKKLKCPV